MLFNSHVFLFLFLPAVLTLWYASRSSTKLRLTWLTLASYVFYGYWDWRFTSLMLVSTVVDYIAGKRIHAAHQAEGRRFWLLLSLATNLTLLGFFKYSGLLVETINNIIAAIGSGAPLPVPSIILPIGISFYTFQSMSYSIDIYRGQARPAVSFLHFAAYVSLFPQLIAGPIVRYTELEDQLRDVTARVQPEALALGLQFFVLGLAKKLLIADLIASGINPLFNDISGLDFVASWIAMLGYTMQIYFDFSGYSDMAVGLGLLLGFRLPQNFDSPYKSRSISEFWRRWHMTLSFWLRDYLYFSLGGNQKGRFLTLVFLVITMFLGGLWHGAAWTFVIWGLYHGLLLVIYHSWRSFRPRPFPALVSQAVTIFAVIVGWVFFRAPNLTDAQSLFSSMMDFHSFEIARIADYGGLLVLSALAWGITILAPNTFEFRFSFSPRSAVAFGLLLCVCVLRFSETSPFLYFQF